MYQGFLLVLPGASVVVTGPSISLYSSCQCFQVLLIDTAFVQSTLEYDHPGILVQQLPNDPRELHWQKYILMMYNSQNNHALQLRYLSGCIWKLLFSWITLSDGRNILSNSSICFQPEPNHIHCSLIAVIRTSSYTQGHVQYPLRVWFSHRFHTCKFILYLLSFTPDGSQWLKQSFLIHYQ